MELSHSCECLLNLQFDPQNYNLFSGSNWKDFLFLGFEYAHAQSKYDSSDDICVHFLCELTEDNTGICEPKQNNQVNCMIGGLSPEFGNLYFQAIHASSVMQHHIFVCRWAQSRLLDSFTGSLKLVSKEVSPMQTWWKLLTQCIHLAAVWSFLYPVHQASLCYFLPASQNPLLISSSS